MNKELQLSIYVYIVNLYGYGNEMGVNWWVQKYIMYDSA